MAKFLCPVAKCEEIISPQRYMKHVRKYEEKHSDNPLLAKSHDRFASSFFPDIWNGGLPPEAKWRKIAWAYRKKQVEEARIHRKNTDRNITMKDGKVNVDGEEYTPEQFSQMQKGVKYLPLEHR